MAHPLAPDLRAGDFHTALVANGARVPNPLVFTAIALPVLSRTEDALAEKPAMLRLERAVVDRLRLGYFSVRPGPDRFGGSQAYANRVTVVDVQNAIPGLPGVQRVTPPRA